MNRFVFVLTVFLFLFGININNSYSCKRTTYPYEPEILWPVDNSTSIPIDSSIFIKISSTYREEQPINIKLLNSNRDEIDISIETIKSKLGTHSYPKKLLIIKPIKLFNHNSQYSLELDSMNCYLPIDKNKVDDKCSFSKKIEFKTSDHFTNYSDINKPKIEHFFSKPGTRSSCRSSSWWAAITNIFFEPIDTEYPYLYIVRLNQFTGFSLSHVKSNNEPIRISLPNTRTLDDCPEVKILGINNKVISEQKLCEPQKCINAGESVTPELLDKRRKDRSIEIPKPKWPMIDKIKEMDSSCSYHPPFCYEYWELVKDTKCE